MTRLVKRLALIVTGCAPGWFALPAPAQSSGDAANTQVRFRFFHGPTVVGNVTVELFDQDKPVTVANFLHYLTNGAYDNLILQRCVPGFVIQAGSARSVNPWTGAQFDSYLPTITADPIVNEFSVGTARSNVFGTLAMAKVDGDPDSATADWFLNLADNSANLDTNNGGFTVFGRLISGENVLQFFNRTKASLGIMDLSASWGNPLFASLPVAYTPNGVRQPRFSDLYHVQVTLVTVPADNARPVIRILSPPDGFRTTSGTVTVSGTASDRSGLSAVWYLSNYGDQTNAVGTTNWTATVQLQPGTNYFYAQSVDTVGRRSGFAWRKFFWSVPRPLDVRQIGQGRIVGPTNGQPLEINRIYALRAIPAPRHMFMGWTLTMGEATFSYPNPAIGFWMRSNMVWTATFVTNPFPPLQGAYAGAAFNTNILANPDSRLGESLCAINFNVTPLGSVSGRLRQGGRAYSFTGSFPPHGLGSFVVQRAGRSPLRLSLNLDVTNRSERISGFVTDDATWLSWLQAERVVRGTVAAPSAWKGRYTVALPGGTDASTTPPGDGPAVMTVSAAADLSLVGTLADGTPFTYATPVSVSGNWPLCIPLYGGRGVLFAWSLFDTNQPNDDLKGLYVWLKQGPIPSKFYPGGFVITNILTGSVYRPPASRTDPVLQFSNGVVTFTDGNLAAPVTSDIVLGANNVVTNLGPTTVNLVVVKANGLFRGNVWLPGATRATAFKGTVLQKRNAGTGYFLGMDQAGQVYFGP